MKRRVFNSLQPGDMVEIRGNKYYVLGKRFVPYTVMDMTTTETIVSITPPDDDYIRDVGEYDREVPYMTLLKEKANE